MGSFDGQAANNKKFRIFLSQTLAGSGIIFLKNVLGKRI